MKGKLSGNIKCLILSLLVIAGIGDSLSSQTSTIGGVINQYGRVNSIGVNFVIINDPVQFSYFQPGNIVLLIQMKGVRMSVLEDVSYGSGGNYHGIPGKHEFLVISSVDGGTNKITFTAANLNPAFDIDSYLQLVKVPNYSNALVTSKLEAAPWDSASRTGGVLAAIVGNTLSLNANIDVTGLGFKGGNVGPGKGICMTQNPPDELKWSKNAYSAFSDSAGFKGEGMAMLGDPGSTPYLRLYPEFAKGQGANFSGGGGGNGKFSGGGGGGNYGLGGRGGREMSDVCIGRPGGEGGKSIPISGLFMGGGGGASTQLTTGATSGGNGGGIILLVCDTLKGNGYSILASGGTPSGSASGEAGAGGGGAGGSIGIYLQSYSLKTAAQALTIKADGGKGGDNSGQTFGEGGGGGGGLISTNNITTPANVNKTDILGGAKGNKSGITIPALAGSNGKIETNFEPVLNGFLFNSIRSSVTGNEIDSICSNQTPKPISGTIPIGVGPFIYLWQKTYDLAGPESEIIGAVSKDYSFPGTEINTFWVRRVITDNGAIPVIRDTSNWVKIVVQPAITGNNIGKDTTICKDQNPLALAGIGTPTGGYGKINYHWFQNTLNNWPVHVNADGPDSTKVDFDPLKLSQTTYYKRKVTTGHCVDYSSTVIITVLPTITGNSTVRSDSVICEGSLFNVLGASAAGAGSGAYVYQWQDSTTTGLWLPATGTNVNLNYTPDTLQFATIEKRYFRRVVFSGPDSVCQSRSIPILLTRWHKIKNNIITAPDNMICSGQTPVPLTGTAPVNGNGTYAYQWQDSSKLTTWTTRFTSITPYAPPSLTDTTWYKRIVTSSFCTNTSNKVFINVHDPVINFNIAGDTTICNGAIPQKVRGQKATGGNGSVAYQWYYSNDNFVSPKLPVPITGTAEDFTPVALTTDTWYKREVISGECFETSNVIKVTVLPLISNNVIAPSKPTVCYNTTPGQISGTSLTGGTGSSQIWIWEQSTDGTAWMAASGTNNQQNYTPPVPQTVKMWYRRIVKSGLFDCCIDTSSAITIDINPLPTGTITNISDTTICNGLQVQIKVHLTGAANWTVVYNEVSGATTTPVTVNNISLPDVIINRIPAATASMSTFNFSLFSVQDNNGCLATSMTGSKKADVYRVPVANAGTDDEICGPEYTFAAVPSDGAGTWTWDPSVPVIAPFPTGYNSTVKFDTATFTTANVAYTFYWEEKNWLCSNKDEVTITFHNRIDTISAGTDTAIFTFDFRTKLKAFPIKSFETGLWSTVNGSGTFDNDAVESTFVSGMAAGSNIYKWLVTNGLCTREDLITIGVTSAIVPEGISPNGDFINDTLVIKGLDLDDQIIDLTIINGAGTQVYKTSNREGKSNWQNWVGKNSKGGELPEGTYYYMLKVESPATGIPIKPISGFIILKRH